MTNHPSAATPEVSSSAHGSASEKRRFVTIVYEIKNDAAWRDGGNPLNYQHNGLKSVCVSAGDLASLIESIEGVVQNGDSMDEVKYFDLFAEHVMRSLC